MSVLKNLESIINEIKDNPDVINEALQELHAFTESAQNQISLEYQQRQKLLEGLKKIDIVSKSIITSRVQNLEKNTRLIRDGVALEVEGIGNQIKKDLQFLKSKNDLSPKGEQCCVAFLEVNKTYVEKKKQLEQIEKNLDRLRREQAAQTVQTASGTVQGGGEAAGTLNKFLLLARQLNNDLRKLNEGLISAYSQVEQQIQADYKEEEKLRTAFYTCVCCLDENKQKEMVALFQGKVKTAPIEARKAYFKSVIEALVKNNANTAHHFHILSRENTREFMKSKLLDEAVSEIMYALSLWKDDPLSFQMLSKILAAKGDAEGSFASLQEVLRLNPEDFALRKKIAYEWLKKEEREKAIAEFEIILNKCPLDHECRNELGKVYYQMGNYTKVIELLEKSLQTRPDDMEYLFYLALSHIQCRNYLAALPLLEQILHYDPQNEEIIKQMVECYRNTGHHQSAIKLLTQFIQKTKNSMTLRILLASVLEEIGEWAKADALYTQIITKNPALTKSLLIPLANVRSQTGKIDQATQYYGKAIQDNQSNPQLILSLCALLRQKGKYDQAQPFLESVLKNDSANLDFKKELTLLFISNHQWEKARQLYMKTEPSKQTPVKESPAKG